MEFVRGRSINLALSKRGQDALAAIGMVDHVVRAGMPMHGRMIHGLKGNTKSIPYGKANQCIISIDRRKLNEDLLSAAEGEYNVNIYFEHKLESCKFDSGEMTFTTTSGVLVKHADLIIGCDGAFSLVRRQMAKSTRLNFSQEYIPHGYMELAIPPLPNGQFAMDTGHLHIWPRNEFMMIGLPNVQDNSFVVTLIMPFAIFEGLKEKDDIVTFFEKTFPDALPLIGRDQLVKSVMNNEPLPLLMVKCSPYHVGNGGLIMGDAAHAMLPFYGQGMNCGLEDALIFSDLLDKYNNDFSKAIPEFTLTRNEDCKIICDLAMYNYVEMRKSVTSRMFLVRKSVDNFLHRLMPQTWVPLYTMVTFTRKRYRDCINEKRWQDKVLYRVSSGVLIATVVSGTVYAWRTNEVSLSPMVAAASATFSKWAELLHLGHTN